MLERGGEDVKGRKERREGKDKEGKEETRNRCLHLVRSIHIFVRRQIFTALHHSTILLFVA
jgi:hypothetical protein